VDFEFSAEQEQLRGAVRRFLEERAPIAVVRALLADARGTRDELWKGLCELGLPGILVPEEHGGAGLGMLEMGVALEELGRALHPGPFHSCALEAVSLLRAAGSREDQARWLPELAAGARIATVALYEPGRRWAWRDPACRASREGEGWRLTGSKVHVPDALAADLYLVPARAGAETAVFAVERGAPGLSLRDTPSLDGTRKQGAIELARAPALRLGRGDAADAIAASRDRAHAGLVIDGLGAAARAFELALAYAQQRQQFGRPIGAFQAVQHMLVDMLQDLELGRAAAYYALWAAEQADPAERHRAVAIAMAFASEAFPRLAEQAIQVFGGVGFTWEYDIHLYYKRLLTLRHAHGLPSDHLEELARLALDGEPPPRSAAGPAGRAGG
jgi:alkylation response protein AidB-like acyl-CoA dehydrogenase